MPPPFNPDKPFYPMGWPLLKRYPINTQSNQQQATNNNPSNYEPKTTYQPLEAIK